MGGNAITKHIPKEKVIRLDRFQYRWLIDWIKQQPFFTAAPENVVLTPTLYAANKETFGDLDLLFKDPGPRLWNLFLSQGWATFGEVRIKNGDVVSIGVNLKDVFGTEYTDKYFQVDFIKVSVQKYENMVFYTSFGDVGHILGMLFNKADVKYGSEGLFYTAHFDTTWGPGETTIKITDSVFDVLSVLHLREFICGYDETREALDAHRDAEKAAENIHEDYMWAWIISLPLFKRYARHFLRKEPDETRPTFSRFIKYVKEHVHAEMSEHEAAENTTKVIDLLLEMDPQLLWKIHEAKKRAEENGYIRSIFDGHLVAGVTGLQGKELGSAIGQFKASQPDWAVWALQQTAETMKIALTDWWSTIGYKLFNE